VDEPVERREDDGAIRHRAVERIRVRLPALLAEPDAERTEALFLEQPLRLCDTERLARWVNAVGEIPEPLPPLRPAIAISPQRWRIVSMWPTRREPYQRWSRDSPAALSSSSRERSGPRRSSSRSTYRLNARFSAMKSLIHRWLA